MIIPNHLFFNSTFKNYFLFVMPNCDHSICIRTIFKRLHLFGENQNRMIVCEKTIVPAYLCGKDCGQLGVWVLFVPLYSNVATFLCGTCWLYCCRKQNFCFINMDKYPFCFYVVVFLLILRWSMLYRDIGNKNIWYSWKYYKNLKKWTKWKFCIVCLGLFYTSIKVNTMAEVR